MDKNCDEILASELTTEVKTTSEYIILSADWKEFFDDFYEKEGIYYLLTTISEKLKPTKATNMKPFLAEYIKSSNQRKVYNLIKEIEKLSKNIEKTNCLLKITYNKELLNISQAL